MGRARFLYNQFITTDSAITPSSQANGVVGTPVPEVTGSGSMSTQGPFTGTTSLLYTVEIDGGGDVGVATFRWRKDTSSGWEASGVLTSTSFQALDNGVKVKFTAGAGADFNAGDRWTFKATRFFSKGKLIDWDPDTPWRSSSLESPSFLTVDLGSAKNVKAVCIFSHNITSGATVLRLLANTSDSWGSPPSP